MFTQHPLRASAALVVLALGAAPCIHAQSYPTKPVRMIVPFAPGGNTDIIARVFAPKMGEILGQQIIIDNRGGAGSTIGTNWRRAQRRMIDDVRDESPGPQANEENRNGPEERTLR